MKGISSIVSDLRRQATSHNPTKNSPVMLNRTISETAPNIFLEAEFG